MRALIIGCGYIGKALGQKLTKLGHNVTGICRSLEHNTILAKLGIRPINLDISKEGSLATLDTQFDWVVITAASSQGGEKAYKKVYGLGSENIARWLKTAKTQSVVYVSSTSVYQQTNAEWVFESNTDIPEKGPSKILWKAEQTMSAAKPPITILRSSGIYGPGRGHLFRRFICGNATIEGEGRRYLNMVHCDDLVDSIAAALELADDSGLYNITDNEPVTQFAFYKWLSEATGRPMPPSVVEPDPSTRMRSLTNKRVSNRRFKEAFRFKYKYPTFREGFTEELKKWN